MPRGASASEARLGCWVFLRRVATSSIAWDVRGGGECVVLAGEMQGCPPRPKHNHNVAITKSRAVHPHQAFASCATFRRCIAAAATARGGDAPRPTRPRMRPTPLPLPVAESQEHSRVRGYRGCHGGRGQTHTQDAASQRVSFCSRAHDAQRPIARGRRPQDASCCTEVPTKDEPVWRVTLTCCRRHCAKVLLLLGERRGDPGAASELNWNRGTSSRAPVCHRAVAEVVGAREEVPGTVSGPPRSTEVSRSRLVAHRCSDLRVLR